MAQTDSEKYNPKLLEKYLKDYPEASNKDLYEECSAVTSSQKGYIRKKKSRLLNKNDSKGSIDPGIKKNLGPINILSAGILEQLICKRLNDAPTEGLLRIALDFYTKVKGRLDTLDDDIDMEVLKEIGINLQNSE